MILVQICQQAGLSSQPEDREKGGPYMRKRSEAVREIEGEGERQIDDHDDHDDKGRRDRKRENL